MPNGGSDCCGTCPFNEKNKGEAGYRHSSDLGRDYCTIRQYVITGSPFYTYCANHPHHNPEGIDIPVGPVFEGDSNSNRWVSAPSSDTPALRAKLLALIEWIPVTWVEDYPSGLSFAEAVVMQLGEWRERAALPALERIASSEVEPQPRGSGPFARSPTILIDAARRAIDRIGVDVD